MIIIMNIIINNLILNITFMINLCFSIRVPIPSLLCGINADPMILINKKFNQLQAVSRTHQGMQMEPSVKTLHSPLSADFWFYSHTSCHFVL